jgi:hypothetical protein
MHSTFTDRRSASHLVHLGLGLQRSASHLVHLGFGLQRSASHFVHLGLGLQRSASYFVHLGFGLQRSASYLEHLGLDAAARDALATVRKVQSLVWKVRRPSQSRRPVRPTVRHFCTGARESTGRGSMSGMTGSAAGDCATLDLGRGTIGRLATSPEG